jgi:hypothetical protein
MKKNILFMFVFTLVSTGFGESIVGSKITPPIYSDVTIVMPMDVYIDAFFSKLDPQFLSQSRVLDSDVNILTSTADSFRKKKEILEDEISSLGLSMYRFSDEPKATEENTCSSIKIDFNKATVLKFGNIYCALIIERPKQENQREVNYTWWLQLDGSGEFSSSNVIKGKGLLAKGPMVRIKTKDNTFYDWDLGNNTIKAGGFLLETSNFNSIILPDVDLGIRIGIAVTQFEDIKKIPRDLASLSWKYNKVNEVSESHTVSRVNGIALDLMTENR